MTTVTAQSPKDQPSNQEILEMVKQATRDFLAKCQACYQRLTDTASNLKELLDLLGWTIHVAKAHAKVWEWLGHIKLENLELLDEATLKSLCFDRYLGVIDQLRSHPLTIKQVRQLIKEIDNAAKGEKEPKPVREWKRSKEGIRKFNIYEIPEEVGDALEAAYKTSDWNIAYGKQMDAFTMFFKELVMDVLRSQVQVA